MNKPAKPATPAKRPSSPRKAAKMPERTANPPGGAPIYPIVGIGASAGGLEALEQFLDHVPADSGMAFVIIQHLDPTHRSMLPELLQRITPMPVHVADNLMHVKRDSVYVAPPGHDVSIRHGTLHLHDPALSRAPHLPIDFFFRALAEDRRKHSIGVILSGMGSDGTLGLSAIKEHGGLALVQEPGSAKFDVMPRSVIQAGLADIIATSQELPARLIEHLRHALPGRMPTEQESAAQKSALEKILSLLRGYCGHDFSLYKKSTLYRRVERRMGLHHLKKIADYADYLRDSPQEAGLLFKELLIGVTQFFRNPAAWSFLREQALPDLIACHPNGRALRAWVAGCSTGEEVYSLAIAFREVLGRLKPQGRYTLQIFATDLDADAIEIARRGYYPAGIAADMPEETLARYFIKEDEGYRVSNEIREMVVFAPHNLIMDPPFTKLDLLVCRNLLIYFGSELQQRLLPLFHYCLNPCGILFLGNTESIGNFTALFTPLSAELQIYHRGDRLQYSPDVNFPNRSYMPVPRMTSTAAKIQTTYDIATLAGNLLLQEFSPAAVLVNSDGDVLFISGHTGKYLEPPAGKANWNIYAMAREGLRDELALALPRALREKKSINVRGVRAGRGGDEYGVSISAHRITEPEALRGTVMIVLADMPEEPGGARAGAKGSQRPARGRMEDLEHELRQAYDEMQVCKQSFRAVSEEAQSVKEELQSSNEELTTSREELQSVNEELQMINSELQAKLDELFHDRDDLDNLFNSTNFATVFLDDQLHIRRFNAEAKQIFRLIPGDGGRPLSDIANDLDYPDMTADAREVLRTLSPVDRQVAASNARWFKVRITPYRTLDNRVAGVIETFVDITEIKTLETELQRMRLIAEAVETRDPGTAGHARWVAGLACAIASELGMEEESIHGLHLAGIVHDIGKLWIPAEILGKSARLTELDREMIMNHVRSGYEILKDIRFPWPVADMVLQHHERLDGSGYPNGLKGSTIMPEARILAIADVVEAMSPHRTVQEIDAALAEIEQNRGIAYDAAAADACIRLFREKGYSFPAGDA